MGWRIADGKRYGFITIGGAQYALTKLGLLFLRVIPIAVLLLVALSINREG
jgi:hypothetical protein